MKRRTLLTAWGALGVSVSVDAADEKPVLRIELNLREPEKSVGRFTDGPVSPFPVGFGKNGFRNPGEKFVGGSSLLGEFVVNAILTSTSFQMTDELVAESGRSRDWLAKHLFTNMSSIDFDGDGKGGEYGTAFLGLEPVNSKVEQPFHFGEYRGTFRWYSYAIHGTQDENRIGKRVTGGCINVGQKALALLVERLQLGSRVTVEAADG